MNEEAQRPPHMTRHEQSQDKSAKSDGGGSSSSSHSEVHDRTGLYISIIALILSAMGFMGMLWAVSESQRAEREYRLLQLEVYGFKNALHAHGIRDVNPHLPGEPD